MNIKELYTKYVGKNAAIKSGGLIFQVTIKDIKISYGKVRFLVTPISGEGEVWVEQLAPKV